MATRKRAVATPAKPVAAPTARAVAIKPNVPAPSQAPKASVAAPPFAPKAPQPGTESGKVKDGKDKRKKEKKVHDGDSGGKRKKMVRDSFTMPTADYALIGVLKSRTLAAGTAVKKSELLRGGLVALAAMSPAQLIDLISAMPAVKTGRPGKKK